MGRYCVLTQGLISSYVKSVIVLGRNPSLRSSFVDNLEFLVSFRLFFPTEVNLFDTSQCS